MEVVGSSNGYFLDQEDQRTGPDVINTSVRFARPRQVTRLYHRNHITSLYQEKSMSVEAIPSDDLLAVLPFSKCFELANAL